MDVPRKSMKMLARERKTISIQTDPQMDRQRTTAQPTATRTRQTQQPTANAPAPRTTAPKSIEMADVDNILFGIDTPARYFEAPIPVKEESDEEEQLPAEVEEVAFPMDDETAAIPVINLQRNEGSGADLDRVQDALLSAGFAVPAKPTRRWKHFQNISSDQLCGDEVGKHFESVESYTV
ncbi:hypothetical protein R1sor_005193 [Riccia sorocarpa]|uniref:Uncharacterized protein n=1 Tax=Riccia sorocarpa TaxID=122646 RepID=A0ABD3HMB3_9MARC